MLQLFLFGLPINKTDTHAAESSESLNFRVSELVNETYLLREIIKDIDYELKNMKAYQLQFELRNAENMRDLYDEVWDIKETHSDLFYRISNHSFNIIE